MNDNQRKAFHRYWWPPAAKALGVKASDRPMKLRACMWALSLSAGARPPTQLELINAIRSDETPSRWLESSDDLTDEDEITVVKKCLGMLADNVASTNEVGHPEFNKARQKRDVIRGHLKCLALFEPQPRRFLAHLIRDMFAAKLGVDVTINELTDAGKYPSDLQRLVMRFAAVVNQKRNENVLVPPFARLQGTEPLTIHEMKLTAGVRCDCAICSKIAARTGPAKALVPALAENWSDFDPELETVTDEFGGSGGAESGDNPF